MLVLVPFKPEWASATGPSGAPLLDIKAIYRRPRKTMLGDPILDEAGFPEFDLTGGLPVQHHQKWIARGFEYVTLATRNDLIAVAHQGLAEQGVQPLHDWATYVQNRFDHGPWDPAQYQADLKAAHQARIADLKEAIARYGPEAAEAMERRVNPSYRLPAAFAKGTPKDETPIEDGFAKGRKVRAAAVSA